VRVYEKYIILGFLVGNAALQEHGGVSIPIIEHDIFFIAALV
jgi:hypothetical protein